MDSVDIQKRYLLCLCSFFSSPTEMWNCPHGCAINQIFNY